MDSDTPHRDDTGQPVTDAPRRRHPARAARVLTAGLSTAAAFGIVAALAQDSDEAQAESSSRTVEVRIGEDVGDEQARQAIRDWLRGQPDLGSDEPLTVVEGPADTTTTAS